MYEPGSTENETNHAQWLSYSLLLYFRRQLISDNTLVLLISTSKLLLLLFTSKYVRALQREQISYRIFIENENKNAEKASYNIHVKCGQQCYIAIYILSFYKT